MSLTKITENLNNVSSLPNQPAMSADELKSVFDKSGNKIKEYINNTLTDEIEELITTKVNEARTIVENTLTSTSAVNALSANSGRELKEEITSDKKEINEKIEEIINNFSVKEIKELYYNAEASYNSITLNDNITNYDIIVVICQSSDGYQGSVIIYKPYVGARIGILIPQITDNTVIYNKQAVFEFQKENEIYSIQNHQLLFTSSSVQKPQKGNYIRLKSILGIKL